MKWLTRLVSGAGSSPIKKRGRTPVPPKPYTDKVDGNVAIREDKHQEILANLDSERPHWRDPKFESRTSTPFFDLFGFNRNWSFSLWKVGASTILFVVYQEFRLVAEMGEDSMRLSGGHRSAVPEYARDDLATEQELRAAGFSYVGVKEVDAVGAAKATANSQRL